MHRARAWLCEVVAKRAAGWREAYGVLDATERRLAAVRPKT
jgi:hypothetical protein